MIGGGNKLNVPELWPPGEKKKKERDGRFKDRFAYLGHVALRTVDWGSGYEETTNDRLYVEVVT